MAQEVRGDDHCVHFDLSVVVTDALELNHQARDARLERFARVARIGLRLPLRHRVTVRIDGRAFGGAVALARLDQLAQLLQ